MKTILHLDIEGFKDGSVYYEIAKGVEPSIGRFGPQTRVLHGHADSFDDAIRDIAKVLETNPEVQQWAKAQTE